MYLTRTARVLLIALGILVLLGGWTAWSIEDTYGGT